MLVIAGSIGRVIQGRQTVVVIPGIARTCCNTGRAGNLGHAHSASNLLVT